MNRRVLWLACTALTTVAAPSAHAADWTGVVSNDWFTGGNWSAGVVPGGGDLVVVDTTVPNPTGDQRRGRHVP